MNIVLKDQDLASEINMRKITVEEYLEYIRKHDRLLINNQEIILDEPRIKKLYPDPSDFIDEKRGTDTTTTVWSFPIRGKWATHRGNYRGNWPPQIPHLLILQYTKPGDTILDPMIGSGTTCIEAKLLGRNCIGIDINYDALILSMHRIYHLEKYIKENKEKIREELEKYSLGKIDLEDVLSAKIELFHGDARSINILKDNSIDLVLTHPPYFNIIKYSSKSSLEGDLSRYRKLIDYLRGLKQVLEEIYRVLKPGHYMGILVGDTRIRRHYVPLTHYVLELILQTGFILKEEIVKIQHKMKTTREFWQKIKERDYLLIYHEKLFIARKPKAMNEYKIYKYSTKQEYTSI